MSKLRNYQDALVCAAREPGNHVVVLPTGAGKTLISFELIFTALLRHPKKMVVFLAPTILLVNQQHQEFGEEAKKRGRSIQIGRLAGGKRENLGRCQVLFATPAAAEQLCSIQELKAVSLLVMDEVHHAQTKKGTGRHPYAQIATAYSLAPPYLRPKLLGLTASPGETLEQTERLLKQLEARLLQITAPALRNELSATVPRAKLVTQMVLCSPEFQRFLRDADARHRELQRQQSWFADSDSAACEEVISRMKSVAELSARVRCLCWGEAAKMTADLPQIPVDEALSSTWNELLRSSAGFSPCFEHLLKVLREQHSQSSGTFRCIVFVETRRAAREMTRVLRFVAESEADFTWLSPTCLLGHCKRGTDDDESMTMAQQNEILKCFRNGVTNCMVATSVAEEGIDVACCNLVVRMEPAHTVIKFIQARGRARYPSSHYVIMCCNPDEAQVVSTLEIREDEMKRSLDSLAESRPSYQAENCWTGSGGRLAEPVLAYDPRVHEHRNHESRPSVLYETEVDIEDLVPTQATVKKTFTDGRNLLDLMVRLVQKPEEIVKVPLMRVARGSSLLLGRRSSMVDGEVWYSADNRRCFTLKVIAPLCHVSKLLVGMVDWSAEFDDKLGQCPQTGCWATDSQTIEEVRNQVIQLVMSEIPPELPPELPMAMTSPPKRGRITTGNAASTSSSTFSSFRSRSRQRRCPFDPDTDYVSQLNRLLASQIRPHSGKAVAKYSYIRTGNVHLPKFLMSVEVDGMTFQGREQCRVKDAKQSAAFEAWQVLFGHGHNA